MSNIKDKFSSTKLIDGFSACFRQFSADKTHCKFLHGYSIYFHVTFEGELDERGWIMDFGFLKRSKNKINWDGYDFNVGDWFKYIFDHTVIVAEDDPFLTEFKKAHELKIIQLRILPKVGCERFAKLVYEVLNEFIYKETNDRVRVTRVECFEHEKNSAIYEQQVL